MSLVIGRRSTHDVRCAVCNQTFGNAQMHTCPFSGVEHANMHRRIEVRLAELENELAIHREAIGCLIRGTWEDAALQMQRLDAPPRKKKLKPAPKRSTDK